MIQQHVADVAAAEKMFPIPKRETRVVPRFPNFFLNMRTGVDYVIRRIARFRTDRQPADFLQKNIFVINA
ncbi:hypothetical protein [Xanthomonas fragariae]|uniref:hypothetical protein n=1 Tax=Xanthomonas fragariae TaxID=48664 RepID=UPI0011AB34D3|nr:hypothetical protein [Xanthomonas fragariae]MDM7556056.1 hypothetical protein [Xanthomonas fragariae]MDM7559148.1 hypothetical protein [Xanthomonas fragariae]MDM7576829.1 hypothetical protein [Xanthomonas fragariae]MDM7579926.1 hypothetical protein [Xanthomonas fragariae]MDM7590121.1 hypothetical protein [Xanthomonas fragariae]